MVFRFNKWVVLGKKKSDRGLWPFVDEVADALDVAMPPGEV